MSTYNTYTMIYYNTLILLDLPLSCWHSLSCIFTVLIKLCFECCAYTCTWLTSVIWWMLGLGNSMDFPAFAIFIHDTHIIHHHMDPVQLVALGLRYFTYHNHLMVKCWIQSHLTGSHLVTSSHHIPACMLTSLVGWWAICQMVCPATTSPSSLFTACFYKLSHHLTALSACCPV